MAETSGYTSVHEDTVIGSAKPKRRRIIQEMRMTKIDAVDNPAQEGARFTICKRADDVVEDIAEMAQAVREGILAGLERRL